MICKTLFVLGGGIGGLTAAQHLRRLLRAEHRVVVVEKKNFFYMCAFNMQLITGEMKHPHEAERDLSQLARKGIDWVHAEIDKIDLKGKRVHTSSGTLEGDYIIIALGAEKLPDALPGFAESAYNLTDAYGVLQLQKALDKFDSGRVVILVCSTPYSCPGAPCESAFLVDSTFQSRKNRQRVDRKSTRLNSSHAYIS